MFVKNDDEPGNKTESRDTAEARSRAATETDQRSEVKGREEGDLFK